MARYRITTPDGKRTFEVEGPDDATEAELQEFARQQAGVMANYPVEVRPPAQQIKDPESGLLEDIGQGVREIGTGILEGGANVLDHAAGWLNSGVRAVSGVDLNEVGAGVGLSSENDLVNAVPAATPGLEGLRGAGRFIGEAAGTAPLGVLRGGALTQGAIGGALLSEPSDLVGAGLGALSGAAGAYVGSRMFGGLAEIANPAELAPELRTLIEAGVRVEPGQVARSAGTKAGDRFADWTDKATSGVFVGDAVTAARQDSFEDFARATINRAVEPIKAKLPDDMRPGRAAVKWAGDKLSAAYDGLLPKLSASGDEKFITDLASIHAEAQTLAPARVTQFNAVLNNLGRFWTQGTRLTGQNLKAIDTRLGDRIRRLSGSQDADQQDLGEALEAVRDAVHDLVARQNPDYAGELQAINKGWKGLVQVERASGNSKARITPAGYSQAVKQSSDTARRRGYSRGEALNQDLADAASDILPSEYPDSGTAGRWAQSNKSARIKGAFDLARYRAAQAMQPLYLRTDNLSPNLARLLQYGAAASPQLATAGVTEVRR